MKNYALTLQTIIFTVIGYGVMLTLMWTVRFPAARILYSITVGLVCLAAEVYSGYVIVRQLWRWSGAGARLFLKQVPETTAAPSLTELEK